MSVHFYQQREVTLAKASERGDLDFNGAVISFLPDVSRRTLARLRTLRPPTKALQDTGINYRWGYPFHLLVRHNGKSHTFRSPGNLEAFCSTLSLPSDIALGDWRTLLRHLGNRSIFLHHGRKSLHLADTVDCHPLRPRNRGS